MNEYRPGGFQILPVAIKNLLIVNVLVLMAQLYLGESTGLILEKNFALHYWESPLFRPWQLFTYLFMHGGWSHLFGNMFALWMFGSILENRWGTKRFLIFYFICGIGAGLCQIGYGHFQLNGIVGEYRALTENFTYQSFSDFAKSYHFGRYIPGVSDFAAQWAKDPLNTTFLDQGKDIAQSVTNAMINEPAVGASGAVFGVLVAFGYLFPNTYLYFYFLFPVKAKYFITGYIILELFLGIQNSASDNVAHAAHIGGGLIGFLIVYLWNKNDRKNFY